MADHTPGPWKRKDPKPYRVEVYGAGDEWVAQVSERDASLILAAPDLLAAGQRVTKAFRPGAVPVGEQAAALHELEVAIANAKGDG